jgi:hypothetical protein
VGFLNFGTSIMRVTYVFAVLLFLTAGIMARAGFGQSQTMMDLDTHRWRNRLLLVFAPSEDDERYRALRRELQRQEHEIVDRDLLIFHILESVNPGQFIVVLIGKDGGEKLRGGREVDIAEIFSLIDSMPMRQREIRERGKDKR